MARGLLVAGRIRWFVYGRIRRMLSRIELVLGGQKINKKKKKTNKRIKNKNKNKGKKETRN